MELYLVPDEEFHFLSVISDHDIGSYSWTIPSYLSEFWKLEKRIKMTDLLTNTINYSENFTIVGLAVNEINPIVYATNIVTLGWIQIVKPLSMMFIFYPKQQITIIIYSNIQ